MPAPAPHDPQLVRSLYARRNGRDLSAADAQGVAALLDGLEVDIGVIRKLAIPDSEEPATIYSPTEGDA